MKIYKKINECREFDINGEKYIALINDTNNEYARLLVLNKTSYDIYKYISNNDSVEDIYIIDFIKNKYKVDINKIQEKDIIKCLYDFVKCGIINEINRIEK